jgi:hypothetical protein
MHWQIWVEKDKRNFHSTGNQTRVLHLLPVAGMAPIISQEQSRPNCKRVGQVCNCSSFRRSSIDKLSDPVRDEESEQVEGLAIDECPWRKAKGGSNKVTRPQLQPLPSQPKRPRTSHHNTNSIAKDNMSAIISAIPEASNFSLASISERDERPSRRNSRLVEGLPKSNSCGPVTNGIDPNFGEGDSSYNDRF